MIFGSIPVKNKGFSLPQSA